ncbi:hypothetical protein [Parageobacillus thermoglucosidasius]|uniref:Uncharacterized protein n=1 Tax=Parageobacillus thermoglucosidasius TaxID=1426 RepID=A0A1B7KX13_PARTM|nr:hypothetical protein [Parageobacillus thermoglucosidasius]OAT74640.1 hypothetical protein A7K69_02700 [Parageobacillus thermoglucosidasius]
MPVSITSALYKKDGEVRELRVSEIDSESYNKYYKGHLFCTTPNCEARLEFVYSTSRPSYFRTWKHDNHIDNCIYQFERIEGRIGINTQSIIDVEISHERKRRALKEAYRLSKMTEEELEQRRKKRNLNRKKTKTVGKKKREALNIVLNKNNNESGLESGGRRGPNLLKRNADALNDSDVGKVRVLIGFIKDVQYTESSAIIKVQRKNKMVDVKFEEAFFANSPDYQGLFHYIRKYINEQNKVVFTGVGEVRKAKNGDNYEFVVYKGDEFTIENMSLLMLASYYSR